MMRCCHLQKLGAIAGVTGSCHQLQMDTEHDLLIDCGLFQGAEVSPESRAGRTIWRWHDVLFVGYRA